MIERDQLVRSDRSELHPGKIFPDTGLSLHADWLQYFLDLPITSQIKLSTFLKDQNPTQFYTDFEDTEHHVMRIGKTGSNLVITDISDLYTTIQNLEKQIYTINTQEKFIRDLITDISLYPGMFHLMNQIKKFYQVDGIALFVINPQEHTLTLKEQIGTDYSDHQEIILEGNQQSVQSIINSGEPIFISSDTSGNRAYTQYIGIPILNQNDSKQIIGVMELYWETYHEIPESDKEFLLKLADIVSFALEEHYILDEIQASETRMSRSLDRTLEILAYAAELRDGLTANHLKRVTKITGHFAEFVGLKEPEITKIRRGALLHDIGKLNIPDNILLKNGKLTSDEQAIMQTHPQIAQDFFKHIGIEAHCSLIPYLHHERWDGLGYPNRIGKYEIPLEARIFSIIDSWDAMTNDRSYRRQLPFHHALHQICEGAGTQFDPDLVNLFVEYLYYFEHH